MRPTNRWRVAVPLVVATAVLASCLTPQPPAPRPTPTKPPPIGQQPLDFTDPEARETYPEYFQLVREGPVTPGLFDSAVAQGMAYSAPDDLMFVSSYMWDGRASIVSIIRMGDGVMSKNLWLAYPDGTPHTGHVGGLATSRDHLWVASGSGVYPVSFESLEMQADDSILTMPLFIGTPVKASFATFAAGILWVGEFASRDGSYRVDPSHHMETPSGTVNHGLVAGWILDSDTDLIKHSDDGGWAPPDFFVSIPDEVQGAVLVGDYVILSHSYGRKNDSRLTFFANPLDDEPFSHLTISTGETAPLWVLDEQESLLRLMIPPMSEGIVDYHGDVAILYESASEKYRRTARFPQDRIHVMEMPNLQ